MAQYHVPPLEELVEKFESLPGIGHKTAQRLAFHVLGLAQEEFSMGDLPLSPQTQDRCQHCSGTSRCPLQGSVRRNTSSLGSLTLQEKGQTESDLMTLPKEKVLLALRT